MLVYSEAPLWSIPARSVSAIKRRGPICSQISRSRPKLGAINLSLLVPLDFRSAKARAEGPSANLCRSLYGRNYVGRERRGADRSSHSLNCPAIASLAVNQIPRRCIALSARCRRISQWRDHIAPSSHYDDYVEPALPKARERCKLHNDIVSKLYHYRSSKLPLNIGQGRGGKWLGQISGSLMSIRGRRKTQEDGPMSPEPVLIARRLTDWLRRRP